MQPGQGIRYLVTDATSEEAVPEELMVEDQQYDAEKYLELLISVAATLLGPFGYGKEELDSHLRLRFRFHQKAVPEPEYEGLGL